MTFRGSLLPSNPVVPCWRPRGLLGIHTREGHRLELTDAPRPKLERGAPSLRIGGAGPMGRILVRGEPGHGIVSAHWRRFPANRPSTSRGTADAAPAE